MHKFVRSITVKADSRQLLYLDNAKHFLSIAQQRKKDATQHLISEFSDYPLEFFTGINSGANAPVEAEVKNGVLTSTEPISEK